MSLVLVINDSEIAAGTRGASLGSRAIEIEAVKKNDDIFRRTPLRHVEHQNNALYDRIKHPLAKRIDAYSKVFNNTAQSVKEVLSEGNFPLIIAADHGNAAGTIAGIKMTHPEQRLGVIWIDAHGDLHSPYTTPSGNMHGMPLAISINEDNTENQVNDPDSETTNYWNGLKNYGDIAPKVQPEDLVFFGVRDTEEPEVQLMRKYGMRNFPVSEVDRRGAATCVEEALGLLSNCDRIYISFDVDSMDPFVVSKGTGTPVKNGFIPETAIDIMKHIIASGKVCCLEIVEANPLLDDKANEMARVTYLILKSLITEINQALSDQ